MFGVVGQADSREARRHLLVAALVWGTGTKARSVNWRARIFEDSTAAEIDVRLGRALDVLWERGGVEAYWAFNNDQKIRHLGPAFFTKVLYFAGHDSVAAPHRPVILDSFAVVVRSRPG